MGSGIAQVVAQSQRSVLLTDRSPELVERANPASHDRLARRVHQ
jgi:3-hydroxyacyl-CoA dehydrogenase